MSSFSSPLDHGVSLSSKAQWRPLSSSLEPHSRLFTSSVSTVIVTAAFWPTFHGLAVLLAVAAALSVLLPLLLAAALLALVLLDDQHLNRGRRRR